MHVFIHPDARAGTLAAADIVDRLVRAHPSAVLGLPTGNTPIALYAELARRHREQRLDFAAATSFNLDEYIGLAPDHPGSFHHYMHAHFFRHVNLPRERAHLPDGNARDAARECERYEAAIAGAGGLDLVILGIGTDGHIAFNEPGSSLGSRTRVKTLTEHTRRDNAGAFGGLAAVPKQVITMGIATLMAARQVILLAFGARKAEIVARAIEGPISALVPASILQMHPAVKAIVDEEAAARLALRDDYRETGAP